jgi:hypothetical protein
VVTRAAPAPTSLAARVRLQLGDIAAAMRDPVLAIWCIYLILTPIYVFKSGLPQPGDMLAILLAPIVLIPWGRRLFPRARVSLRMLWVLVGYIVVENFIWSLVVGKWDISLKKGLWMSPLFYIYNLMIFWTALAMYGRYRQRMLRLTYDVLFYSTMAIVVATPLLLDGKLRQRLLFNSANQLGYHTVLVASVLVIAQRPLRISSMQTSIGLLACTYLSLLSSSKAALGSLAILAGAGVLNKARTVIITAIVGGVLVMFSAPFVKAIDDAEYRIVTDRTHGFLEERGYDRLWKHPEYLIVGSGEGAYERFHDSTIIGSHEMHSSFGTMIFCYGIVGFGLFLWFTWASLRGVGLRIWLCLMPAFAFGFTHQALRTTLFWVLLAMAMAFQREYHLERAPPRTKAAKAPKAL